MTYVHGRFNVEKCVTYLRSVGVEISDAQAQEWRDAERTERFCRSMKGTQRQGWDWWCENGHQHYFEHRRGQRRRKVDPGCSICGARMLIGKARFTELRDGSVRDYRPPDERWKALDAKPSPIGSDPPPENPLGLL